MNKIVAIAVSGGLGALARYVMSGLAYRWLGSEFPYGTLTVNVVGCFLIGLLYQVAESGLPWPPTVRIAIFVGFLGAFTTFSTFGYETIALIRDSEFGLAFLNVGLQVAVGLVAVWLGLMAARLILA